MTHQRKTKYQYYSKEFNEDDSSMKRCYKFTYSLNASQRLKKVEEEEPFSGTFCVRASQPKSLAVRR